MENVFANEIKRFHSLNKIANGNGTLLIGSSFMAAMPTGEFKQIYSVNKDLYNRSLEDLTIASAKDIIELNVRELCPDRVLLQLGETDLERGFKNIPEMMAEYKSIIEMIRSIDKHIKIVLVSVCENEYKIQPAKFNLELEALAHSTKCQYADVTGCVTSDYPALKAFRSLRYFMTGSFSLCEAMDSLVLPETKSTKLPLQKAEPSLV